MESTVVVFLGSMFVTVIAMCSVLAFIEDVGRRRERKLLDRMDAQIRAGFLGTDSARSGGTITSAEIEAGSITFTGRKHDEHDGET